MKQWFSSETKIIFNVILALFLGIVFGNFLGNSMLKNDAIYANAVNYDDEVYLFQAGHFYDEGNANLCLSRLKTLGLDGMVVREYGNFFVYLGISKNRNSFYEAADRLTQNGFEYLIKTRKLYYYLADLNPDSHEYRFYFTTISYYLSLVENRNVVLTDEYIESVDVVTMDLYNSLQLLNSELESNEALLYKLMVYRNLVNLLT